MSSDSESEIPPADDDKDGEESAHQNSYAESDNKGRDKTVSQTSDSESEIFPAVPSSSTLLYTSIGIRNMQDNPIHFSVDDNYCDSFICVKPIATIELAITNCNHTFHETCLLNRMDETKLCFECSGEVKYMISEIDTEEEYLKTIFEWRR